MSEPTPWAFPEHLQPRPERTHFDLEAALRAVVLLHAEVPDEAFTAPILGTERLGNGVVIDRNGLILTIGYLVTEAESLWLTTHDGRVLEGDVLAYDHATGFGLVQPLGRLDVPPIERGSAREVAVGSEAIAIAHGGRAHALATEIIARREFAGYWEYLLDEALFTTPAHPHWSGAALVGADGRLLGIGSLLVQEEDAAEEAVHANMFVPIDLLEPVLQDLLRLGRPARAPRPWLGLYTTEVQGELVVTGLIEGGPAESAGVQLGDVLLEVGGVRVRDLAEFYRRIWARGPAGTEIPLTVGRSGERAAVRVTSLDRDTLLHKPRRH